MNTIIIIIAIIIAILILIALLTGKDMIIERETTINKPVSEVFEYLKQTRNQDSFSTWNMTDPSMNKTYVGTDGEIGFVYKWDSTNKNVGAGEQKIIAIENNKYIEYEIVFSRPMQNVAISKFVLIPVTANETVVMWGFYSGTKLPMRLFKAIFVKMLGKDIEKSLQNLKNIFEK